jgi:hypothetical protein
MVLLEAVCLVFSLSSPHYNHISSFIRYYVSFLSLSIRFLTNVWISSIRPFLWFFSLLPIAKNHYDSLGVSKCIRSNSTLTIRRELVSNQVNTSGNNIISIDRSILTCRWTKNNGLIICSRIPIFLLLSLWSIYLNYLCHLKLSFVE